MVLIKNMMAEFYFTASVSESLYTHGQAVIASWQQEWAIANVIF